ncbi:hypothetical protein EBU94_06945, partial [bacterium]|nr:hypothetical protein [bacterium]
INGFVSDFNTLFPESRIDAYRFSQGDIPQLINISREDFSSYNYVVEVDLYGKDMFLSIQHNPKDILNMSVSRFYGSCQHLYSGGYRNKLLGNVFDPNSIPAFIIFDSPIYHRDELISEQLPLCRRIIRNLESADGSHKIYFDRAYPDRMEEVMGKMIEKYSNNKHSDTDKYVFSPDIPLDDTTYELDSPYMDRLQVGRGYFIGVNTKKITLSPDIDWSKYKISPKAKLEEIIIENPEVPENLFSLKLTPNWVKIKFINILSMKNFSNIQTQSLAFEKCLISNDIFEELNQMKIKKLQFTSCEINNIISNFDLSKLPLLEEIQFIYTIDSDEFRDFYERNLVEKTNLKKIVLSGDIVSDNKNIIGKIKQKGIKVETVGPVI